MLVKIRQIPNFARGPGTPKQLEFFMADRKKRVQLNAKEKESMLKRIKTTDGSDESLLSLVDGWNSDHPDRPIELPHLKRLKAIVPEFSEASEFWETIKFKVATELINPDASMKYEPPKDGFDYNGYQTKVLDEQKIPIITKHELDGLCFDFDQDKYTRSGPQGDFADSAKKLNSEFRGHFQSRGIAYAPFSSFVGRDERQRLNGSWAPSDQIWTTVTDAVLKTKFKLDFMQKGGLTFSDFGKAEDRINPNYSDLKAYFAKLPAPEVSGALAKVLGVCESLYRSVEKLLSTEVRVDSRWRQYAVMPELNPKWFSLLTCNSKKTKVQREHMDDYMRGVAALWGLVEGQYVIVWLFSYEMNLEIERITAFYDFVMEKKPLGWTEEAFWNLVTTIHLENQGFASKRRPRPVKIPLKVCYPF